jgi:hypothetical protein
LNSVAKVTTKESPPPGDWQSFLRHIEDLAAEIRVIAKVQYDAPLDPTGLAPAFKILLVGLDQIAGLSPDDRELILSLDPGVWSGGGVVLPNGGVAVVLHPSQPAERAVSTLMEEIVHAYLKHPPSKLVALPGGLYMREYDANVEKEAYWTGAAALLPSKVVARALWQRRARELATRYGVSDELVEFRIKILGFWQEYQRQKLV